MKQKNLSKVDVVNYIDWKKALASMLASLSSAASVVDIFKHAFLLVHLLLQVVNRSFKLLFYSMAAFRFFLTGSPREKKKSTESSTEYL